MSTNSENPTEIRSVEIERIERDKQDKYFVVLKVNPRSGSPLYLAVSEDTGQELNDVVSEALDDIQKDRRERQARRS